MILVNKQITQKEGTIKIAHGTNNGPDVQSSGGNGNSVDNIGD